MALELYQPVLLPGRTISGRRACEDRLAMILPHVQDGWAILDVGSNFGFFPKRILEERPSCVCLSIESNAEAAAIQRQVLDGQAGVALIQGQLDRAFLERLHATPEHFDLVLLLSVLHHVPADDLQTVCTVLDKLAHCVVIEVPAQGDPDACGGPAAQQIHALGLERLFPSKEFTRLGDVENHLNDRKRTLWLGVTPRYVARGSKAYWGSVFPKVYAVSEGRLGTSVRDRPYRETDWIPGFNPYTWAHLGPVLHPPHAVLLDQATAQFAELGSANTDVRPWNVIFGSDGLRFIDVSSQSEWASRRYSPSDLDLIRKWICRVTPFNSQPGQGGS